MSSVRWPIVLLALLIGIAVGAVGLFLLSSDTDENAATQTTEVSTSLISAQQRDLRRFDEFSGTLQPGPTSAVSASTRGTLTRAVDEGETIAAGDIVAEIDGAPVVALYGSVPQFRELSIDTDTGADIRQLEENLVALGFDPDGMISVDDTFNDATALVVTAWETELGFSAPDGVVSAGQIAFITGPSEVTSRTPVGTQVNAGQQILGTVTLAETGFVTVPAALNSIDPTLAVGDELIEGSEAARINADDETGSGVLVIAPTAEDAIDEDTLDFVAVAPIGATVAAVVLDNTTAVAAGRPIYRWESDLGSIALAVDVSEADTFEIDRPLVVELPDGQLVDATVTDLSDVARAIQDGNNTVTVIDVTVQPNAAIESIFTAGPVTVRVETNVTQGAVLVPASALIALSEGGHAVDVDGRGLVGVELGAFDDGWVEVTNDAIGDGEMVVVPA